MIEKANCVWRNLTVDNRPVGVFDSGLGGLTAVREIMNILPSENVIYFGDTGRVPYGGRSRETIIKYARQDVQFLQSFDLKAIVIACGTVSTTAMDVITREYTLPIFGVVDPTARRAAGATRNGKIALIGTQATVRSGAYERLIQKWNPEAEVRAYPCPLFVPLVENGRFRRGDIVIETVASEYLKPIRDWGADTLVLGCTHYPLLMDVIGEYLGGGVVLVNSGVEVAADLKRQLRIRDLTADPGQSGDCCYYVSDSVEGFSQLASVFLNRDLSDSVEKVDIEKY